MVKVLSSDWSWTVIDRAPGGAGALKLPPGRVIVADFIFKGALQ